MFSNNIAVVKDGSTLHIIIRPEPWVGHGPMYVCGCSVVLLTLLIWNILSLIFALIIAVLGFRCVADEECKGQQMWVGLLVLAAGIMISAVAVTYAYGTPYFRDTVIDVSLEKVTRVHVWPLEFGVRGSLRPKRAIRHGYTVLHVTP